MPSDILTKAEAESRAALISNVDYKVALDLSEDPARRTYRSTTRVSFDCATAGADTFIDLVADGVVSITVNGNALDPTAFANNRIPLRDLTAGKNDVEIVADTVYMQNGVGLHRKVDPSDGNTYLYSHFEPFDAHRVYACFDQPDIKAPFTLTVDAPSTWVVAGNEGWQDPVGGSRGPTTQVSDLGNGVTRTSFATTKHLPPYLTHLTAGPYVVKTESHNGLPMFLMARQSQRDVLDRNAAAMFQQTKDGLDLFATAFGFPYQFAQYGQAFVPEFNAGAMENPGCVVFNDQYIPKGRVTKTQRWRLGEVILHEMAHVYGFGDVVTMKWWDDLHLNETFATFMAYYILSKTTEFGADAWNEFAQSEKTLALAQDQLPSTHPVKARVDTTEEVSQLFDQITYAKGASVIRQLYALIGEDAFFEGLRDYFKKHWFGNATQADFLDALGGAAQRDLQRWGREWMGTASVNTLRPHVTARGGKISGFAVDQTAFTKYPTLRTHRIGVGLYDLDATGALVRRDGIELDVTGARTSVADPRILGAKRPDLILVNDGDLTYAKVRFDAVSLRTLRASIGAISDPLARTVAWTAVWDMARDAELPATHYVQMVAKHAVNENDVAILERLTSQALLAANMYCADGARSAARSLIADTAHAAMQTAPQNSDLQVTWARAYISASETKQHLNALSDLLSGTATIAGLDFAGDADLRWASVMRLAAAGRADAAAIHAEYQRDPSDVAQRREAAALSSIPTAAAKREAWDQIINDRSLSLATLRALCRGEVVGGRLMGGFNQPGQEALVEPYVAAYMAAVPVLWATREENEAEDITEMLFPRFNITETTVRETTKVLRRKLPYGADRMLREARDGTQRALRARRIDAGAARNGASDGVAA